jgi:hypothetical protein
MTSVGIVPFERHIYSVYTVRYVRPGEALRIQHGGDSGRVNGTGARGKNGGQKVTPVKLPEDLIRKPASHLGDLGPGESAWINRLEMAVDPERRCFLNPDAKVMEEGPTAIRATRTEAGFEVFIPVTPIPLRWTPGGYSVKEGYFPVVKLERAAPGC